LTLVQFRKDAKVSFSELLFPAVSNLPRQLPFPVLPSLVSFSVLFHLSPTRLVPHVLPVLPETVFFLHLFTFVFDLLLSCIELLFVLFDVVSDVSLAFGSQFYSIVPHFLPTFPILLPLIFHLHFLLAHSLRDPSALARSPELSPLVPDLQPCIAGQLIASQISLQLLQQRRTYLLFQVLSLFGLLFFLSS
jgi:hypothetical protein